MTSHFSAQDHRAIAEFLSLAGRLKALKRQGWVDRGVDDPESVSDHSWRLALMTLVVGSRRSEIDLNRAVRIALVHDLPEALAGDATPFDAELQDAEADRESLFRQAPQYSEAADRSKTEAERQAMIDLATELPGDVATMLVDAWEEYEAGRTAEAKLVRQLDKLETWLQALEYWRDQPDLVIESFRLGTLRDVSDPGLVSLRQHIDALLGDE